MPKSLRVDKQTSEFNSCGRIDPTIQVELFLIMHFKIQPLWCQLKADLLNDLFFFNCLG